METSVGLLGKCASYQQTLFFRHFMSSGKVGEIMASQVNDHGDRIFFERFLAGDLSFVVVYHVYMEDSMILENVQFSYRKIADFVDLRENENRLRFEGILALKPDAVYEEFTRSMVEDRLPPGKMTINGDRNSQIRILYRQVDVPSDAEQPRLNEYILLKPLAVLVLEQLIDKFEKEILSSDEYVRQLNEWKVHNLQHNMQNLYGDLATALPFLKEVTRVTPRIYEWPRELDAERELGLK